jgi:hypothetical protein
MEPKYLIAGTLRRETLLPPSGSAVLDGPGGDLLYAAAGLTVWEKGVGLLARAGEDYPQEWLQEFEQYGWSTGGIHILPGPLDLRYFQAWTDPQKVQNNNPVAHFARLGLLFPKSMLGYQPAARAEDDLKTTAAASPRPADIPPEYLNAHTGLICLVDYATAARMSSAFRQAGILTVTLDPSAGFMNAGAFADVRILLQGLTALLVGEDKLRGLFWGKTNDLWEMAEAAASFGCETIVIKRGGRGQMLYDSASRKRWEIPAYPARLVDLLGVGDAFCGGFASGLHSTYDPLQAALRGNISASLALEGTGAFHAMEALPGLAQARLEALTRQVRQV